MENNIWGTNDIHTIKLISKWNNLLEKIETIENMEYDEMLNFVADYIVTVRQTYESINKNCINPCCVATNIGLDCYKMMTFEIFSKIYKNFKNSIDDQKELRENMGGVPNFLDTLFMTFVSNVFKKVENVDNARKYFFGNLKQEFMLDTNLFDNLEQEFMFNTKMFDNLEQKFVFNTNLFDNLEQELLCNEINSDDELDKLYDADM